MVRCFVADGKARYKVDRQLQTPVTARTTFQSMNARTRKETREKSSWRQGLARTTEHTDRQTCRHHRAYCMVLRCICSCWQVRTTRVNFVWSQMAAGATIKLCTGQEKRPNRPQQKKMAQERTGIRKTEGKMLPYGYNKNCVYIVIRPGSFWYLKLPLLSTAVEPLKRHRLP